MVGDSITRRDTLKLIGAVGAVAGTASAVSLAPVTARASIGTFMEPDMMRAVTSTPLYQGYLLTLQKDGFEPKTVDTLYALTCETRPDIQLPTGGATVTYEANSFIDQTVTSPVNAGPVGPTMVFIRGRSTGVFLQNTMTGCGQDYFIPPSEPQSHYTPHAFTVTNLHTHGLHVSPDAPSDDVLILVGSSNVADPDDHSSHSPATFYDGQFSYRYDVPDTHPVGTFWYHPHKHGSVSTQIATGMAGALIIRSGADDKDFDQLLDEQCKITQGDERILVFTTINYMAENNRPGHAVFDPLLYAAGSVSPGCPVTKDTPDQTVMLVNGVYMPTITMKKGEMLRFRIVNATVGQVLIPKFKNALLGHPSGLGSSPPVPDVYAVAVDGIALPPPFDSRRYDPTDPYFPIVYDIQDKTSSAYLTTAELINVAAGQRLDLIVHATEAGSFTLWGADLDEAPTVVSPKADGSTPGNVFTKPLLNVQVTADTRSDQTLPTLSLFQEPTIQRPPSGLNFQLADLVPELTRLGYRSLAFSDPIGTEPYFTINGQYFEEGNPSGAQVQLKLDATDWWHNYSKAGAHIFHIHINSFQMVARCPTVDGVPNLLQAVLYEVPIWRDTMYFDSHPPSGTAQQDGIGAITVSKQVDFTGEFVLHCHNVFHEDAGMMFTVSIEA